MKSLRVVTSLSGLLALSWLSGCDGVPPDAEGPAATEAKTGAIHVNPGSTIAKASESNALTGQFPQVMFVNNSCTGEVIAPYTILTAAHCNGGNDTIITWAAGGGGSGVGFNNPYFAAPFEPAWVVALNEYPGMHDQAILFASFLTPQFMAANQLTPLKIDPNFWPGQFTVVGVGSTDGGKGTFRESVPEQWVPVNANSSVYPEDGYLVCDNTTANFGSVDHGDSGGPHIGQKFQTWTDGSTFVYDSAIFATSVLAGCESAPLAHNSGVTETSNQSSTVRLNSLWLRARADDADGDGLPNECDSDPANATGSVNLCPPPLGAPVGAATASSPTAQLQCPFGTMPVGLKGQYGASIQRMGVECEELECFSGTACSGLRTVSDMFGPPTGSAFETACPEGERMVGLSGTSDSAKLYSLTAHCLTSSGTIHNASTVGVTTSGTAFSFNCTNNKFTGVQARSTNLTSVTGLQALCGPTTNQYLVGPGPTQNPMRCPPGQVAVGIGYAVPGTVVQMSGLICAEQAAVAAGQALVLSKLTVLRSGFEAGDWFPPSVEPHSSLHVPTGWTEKYCPTGSAMSGLSVGWDTTSFPGVPVVSGFQQMQCQDIRTSTGAASLVNINVGSVGNAQYVMNSAPFVVDGFATCDAQYECGMSLHATRPPALPTGLTATSVSSAAVNLSWTASATANVTYSVFRSTTSPVATTPANQIAADISGTTFSDPLPTPSAANFYVVEAVNPDGPSWPSNQITAQVPALAGPTNLVATTSFDPTLNFPENMLTWSASNPNAEFAVFRSTTQTFTPSAANLVNETSGTSFTDDGQGSTHGSLSMATKYFYFVEMEQSGGFSQPSNEASVTTAPLQIDCGSSAIVAPFVADELSAGGGTINHANMINISGVTNPPPMQVYQTAHSGPVTYTLPLFEPGSTHTIRLHFAETWDRAKAGTRTFNVKINGTQVLTGFDILDTTKGGVGALNTAIAKPFSVKADSKGTYTIQFINVNNVALISAIEVL
jgi:hypothetical protein